MEEGKLGSGDWLEREEKACASSALSFAVFWRDLLSDIQVFRVFMDGDFWSAKALECIYAAFFGFGKYRLWG